MLKDLQDNTKMRFTVPVTKQPPYEKMLSAPSFKEALLEFVGKEKDRLGDKFEKVYSMHGVEG